MTMRVECTGCGEDCSHGYATYHGDPYHFGCLPVKPAKRRTVLEFEGERHELRPIPSTHTTTNGE